MHEYEFETVEGNELSALDMVGETWKVIETFVEVTKHGSIVFTHRVEVWSIR